MIQKKIIYRSKKSITFINKLDGIIKNNKPIIKVVEKITTVTNTVTKTPLFMLPDNFNPDSYNDHTSTYYNLYYYKKRNEIYYNYAVPFVFNPNSNNLYSSISSLVGSFKYDTYTINGCYVFLINKTRNIVLSKFSIDTYGEKDPTMVY